MDRIEIINMEVGEQLDKCIHENIFGLCWHDWIAEPSGNIVSRAICRKCGVNPAYGGTKYPIYSTNVSDVWQVVDKMLEEGYSLDLTVGSDGYSLAHFFSDPTAIRDNEIVGDSVSEVICKAALLTKS